MHDTFMDLNDMIHLKTYCLFYFVGTVQFIFPSYWKHARTIIIISERFPASCYLGFILNVVVLYPIIYFAPFFRRQHGEFEFVQSLEHNS